MLGLGGPKSGNVQKVFAFIGFFDGSRGARRHQPNEQPSEPEWFLDEKAAKKLAKRKKDELLWHEMASMMQLLVLLFYMFIYFFTFFTFLLYLFFFTFFYFFTFLF